MVRQPTVFDTWTIRIKEEPTILIYTTKGRKRRRYTLNISTMGNNTHARTPSMVRCNAPLTPVYTTPHRSKNRGSHCESDHSKPPASPSTSVPTDCTACSV